MSKEAFVFYRKYRPKTFEEVINQEPIKRTLQNAIKLNRVGHAYLFAGPRGTGKTTLARIFAKTINCLKIERTQLDKKAEPCNSCEICHEIDSGSLADLIEIDAASNRGIDEIREIREGIKFSPLKAKFKVFIIDEAHMLTKEAFNALLKVLEEPPPHAIFILATTEPERLPLTITSRTQRFDFRKITIHDIEKKLEIILKKEDIKADPQALHLIASAAEGSFRDAESLLSQIVAFHLPKETLTLQSVEMILGAMNFNRLSHLLSWLSEGNIAKSLEFLQAAMNDGYDAHELSRMVLATLRKILILKVDPQLASLLSHEHTKEEMETLVKLSKRFEARQLARLVRALMQAHPMVKRSPIPILPLELAIIEAYDNTATT